jgi:hypothetical protein
VEPGGNARRLVVGVAAALALIAGEASAALANTAVPTYTQTVINSPIPEATSFQGFGIALASAGDVDGDGVPDIVASDTSQTVNSLAGAGRSWIIDGSTSQVLLTLTSPNPQAGAAFGRAVINIGTANGVPELAVTAPNENVYSGSGTGCGQPPPNGCDIKQGRAYVFNATNGNLLYTIDDPDPQASGATFGRIYTAAPGDLNGDGIPDLIVTAPGQNDGALTGSGEAFAFSGKDGSLLYRIKNPTPEAGAKLGNGISVPGDLNGDGVSDVEIGAPGATGDGEPQQGRAYVFNGKTGGLMMTLDDPFAQAPGPFGGTSFASDLGSAGAPGDINGDGVPDIFVDATEQNAGGLTNAGEGFIFSGKNGSILRVVDSPSQQTNAGFGFAFANAGDLNGNGTQDMLVGQFSSGNATGYTSGAWVLDGKTGGVLAGFPGTPFGPGDTLASPGDVNGDGCPDFFLGGPTLNVGANPFQGQIIVELSHANPGCRSTSTTVSCLPASVAPGETTTCTATVADTDATGVRSNPSGVVSLTTTQGGRFLPNTGSCTLAATANLGDAACQFSYTPIVVGSGPHVITTSYGGDTNHTISSGSQSLAVKLAVALPPKVTGYKVTNKVFVVGSRPTPRSGTAARAARHKKGTTFKYTLSEAASVKIAIAQRSPGRRKGGRCVAPTRKLRKHAKCTRTLARGALTRTSHQGANSVAFSGRIGSKALKPGTYQATLTATNAATGASKPITIRFTIVAR